MAGNRKDTPERASALSALLSKLLLTQDLSTLTPQERLDYYQYMCDSLHLNPVQLPFGYLRSKEGKYILYAKKQCTDQLRAVSNVTIEVASREVVAGCYVVNAHAKLPSGRKDEDIGSVWIETLKGPERADAMMKAETKAHRRVTLSICGVAMPDESEIDSSWATVVSYDAATGEIRDPNKKANGPEGPEGILGPSYEELQKSSSAPRPVVSPTPPEVVLIWGRMKDIKTTIEECGKVREWIAGMMGDEEAKTIYYETLHRDCGVMHSNQIPSLNKAKTFVYHLWSIGKTFEDERNEKANIEVATPDL
jgi:hypothetical protein